MHKKLNHIAEIDVRFNEADPLGIVWHGHYIRYFEDGREAFGKKHQLTYLDFYRNGIVVPIVQVHCDFKRVLRYGHSIRVHTTYINSPAAKMIFEYKIFDTANDELVATGRSTQVFMTKETHELLLTVPPFMEAWKEKWLSD